MTTSFWLQETQDAYASPCKVPTYPLQSNFKCLAFYTVTMGCTDLQGTTHPDKPRHKSERGC